MQQARKPFVDHSDLTASVMTLATGKPVNLWLMLISLSCGTFMALLDSTMVSIAIADIRVKLNTNLATASWVLNAFNLAFAALLVTVGHFADQFGRKRVFQIGMICFMLGSLLCAIASSIQFLIIARVLEAMGAAALSSVGLAIIIAVFPHTKRAAAIGIWAALGGLASALGPILGGFLVFKFSWQWIFLANLPICILGLFLVARNVPETRDPYATASIDVPGLLLLTSATVCLVLAIIQGGTWGWTSTAVLGLFVVSIVSFALLYSVEIRHPQPIIDFRLFQSRSFFATNVAMFLFGIAIQGATLILILYFITGRSISPIIAALAVLPLSIATFLVASLAGPLSRIISSWIEGVVGMALLSLGFFLFCGLPLNASFLETTWRALIIGVGMGLCLVSFPKTALMEVALPKLGVGSGVLNTFRQIGYALGVAILVSALNSQIQGAETAIMRQSAFSGVWLVAGIIATIGLFCTFFIKTSVKGKNR